MGKKGGASKAGASKGGASSSKDAGNKGAKGGKGGGKASKAGGDLKNFNHVKARHILCEKEGKIRDAYAVIKQNWLDDGKSVPGPKFGEIATKASECSSASKGGNLGWFPRGKMVGEFEQKAFSTPVGEVSQPFKSSSGWHIILVEGRKA